VALKVISPQYVGDESTRQRFVREARAAASLRHENIASVFHLGSTDPGYFYAMEFVEGQSLEQIIASRGALSPETAIEITRQVAAALAAAHQHQLVHRDIIPGNLMVSFKSDDRPVVKVIDFGLAKVAGLSPADSVGSMPGAFFGTLRYASPEQIRQGRADIRSDIYSLGITLWEMLVGEVPFDGTPGEIADQHLHAPPPLARVCHLSRPIVSLLSNNAREGPASATSNSRGVARHPTSAWDTIRLSAGRAGSCAKGCSGLSSKGFRIEKNAYCRRRHTDRRQTHANPKATHSLRARNLNSRRLASV